ncbi:MAG: UDP-N-acetylmuramoylalanine--D-glutamate ligase [Patescibacteria group bacterium]|jgi:UDP-N-acetylmuramoylalanine--D-glutamate ligase|nr:UDP-N-acetylmuramoylalanine--D-glutamate ligase [Patescibacteria group bacterium]
MKDYKEFFKDKKVTQLGLGLLGRGVNDALFLLENGVSDLIITDLKTEAELQESVDKLKQFKNVTFKLGDHDIKDFEGRDFILKGAGVPLDSPYILHAKDKGIPIEMDASLFVKLLPADVTTIGVTGTRGKSTTTHLICHILKTAGKHTLLGGNVRDMATLPLIKEVREGDFVVLELDSWQLQGFGESKISPHVSVFTNFMDDHMNYYNGDMERYFVDKANIFAYQKTEDILVVGEALSQSVYFKNQTLNSKVLIAKNSTVPKDWKLKIIGEHNVANISDAIEACRALGIREAQIKEGVESFGGVEGRLQFVKESGGVKIWNDNNATTPEATIVALEALKENIILFCGGADKNIPIDDFAKKIVEKCKKIILLKGSGTEKLKPLLRDFVEVSSLEEGVTEALKSAEGGGNFLFSPAFASFGMFKNEYDRNDQFLKIVEKL